MEHWSRRKVISLPLPNFTLFWSLFNYYYYYFIGSGCQEARLLNDAECIWSHNLMRKFIWSLSPPPQCPQKKPLLLSVIQFQNTRSPFKFLFLHDTQWVTLWWFRASVFIGFFCPLWVSPEQKGKDWILSFMLGEALSSGLSQIWACVRLPLVRALIWVKPAASGFLLVGFMENFLFYFSCCWFDLGI